MLFFPLFRLASRLNMKIPSPMTIGDLAEVYLTPRARSSRGVYLTVLEILPDVVGAPEVGTWYVVTVGRYTGIYQEWYHEFHLSAYDLF